MRRFSGRIGICGIAFYLLCTSLLNVDMAWGKAKFRPFAGLWLLANADRQIGRLIVDKQQRSAVLELGVGGNLRSFDAKIDPANKTGTAIEVFAIDGHRVRIRGKLVIARDTFQTFHGKLHITAAGDNVSLDVTGVPMSSAEYVRLAKAVLEIEPAGKRIAKAGQAFILSASIVNKGPAGMPADKVTLYISVPDTLSDLEIISSNRMVEGSCDGLHDRGGKSRVAWCHVQSLGPGVPTKAQFAARVVPDAQVFARGGTFTAQVFISRDWQDNVIDVSAVRQQITIRVKGLDQPGPSTADFSGRWVCPQRGIMTITQSGSKITGGSFTGVEGQHWYPPNDGRIESGGEVTENKATFRTLGNNSTYSELSITMADNGQSFSGTWRHYYNNGNFIGSGDWDCQR